MTVREASAHGDAMTTTATTAAATAVREATAPPRPRLGDLIRASGGPRYAVALCVDSLGSGMLRPFLLLYGIKVLGLGVAETGTAMSVGMLLGLLSVPCVGRWIDHGARTAAVAAAMAIRIVGVVLLLVGTGVQSAPLWWFTAAALFLGMGNQCWSPAHAALVTTLADERTRDAALATGRSLRNAGLGSGALIATAGLAGGTGALRVLAGVTGLGYAVAAALVLSMRVRAARPDRAKQPVGPRSRVPLRGRPTVTALDMANLPYAFCFNILEVALPAFLVTRLHVSPAWSAGIFVGNTAMVVLTQIAVVVWMARYRRRTALTVAGVLLATSYLGFWAAGGIGGWGAAAGVAVLSVLYTAGEIVYTGSATALIAATTPPEQLGRALSRFQLTTGLSLAGSPAVLMALLAWRSGALWGSMAAATLLAAVAVRRWGPDDRRGRARDGGQ